MTTDITTNNREVTIYEHVNYQGRSQKLGPGKYNIGDLSIGNDCLSSLKIPEGIRVTLYEHANFMGDERKFDADTPWVGNDFNDKTSSIQVELVTTGVTTNNREVTIYEHGDYQGHSQKLRPGKYNIGDLLIGNDSLSSLKVPEGLRVTVYEHGNFIGNERKFDTDTPWVGDDFNDKTSSILVEPVATIYEHGDYQGRSQKLGPGKYNIEYLAIGNDSLSSLKVPEGLKVTLYEHADFRGNERKFDTDTPWVGNDFNDKTSSILIEPVATIYEHGDYQGRSQKLSPGKYNLGDLSIGNDTLSSLKVPEGLKVTLYEHANFRGNEWKFDTDTPWVGDDFNDKTSSILVELVKTEGISSEDLEQNINVNEPDKNGISDCVEFSVSIFDVLGAGGKICKNGMLTFKGKCLEIPVDETTVDLRQKGYSRTISVGIQELNFGFYFKDSCLWTKGHLDGWLHKKQEWNKKIVSF